ncbi:unnamed protein product [Gemmata massiliana]|uniref:Uncharacterized protein n=1 Tax=Gemmata massiliana TaxID=1210884 RepID=A0A6P2D502_9BACT|nr:unnamed protein product [Gemmata massiliana]
MWRCYEVANPTTLLKRSREGIEDTSRFSYFGGGCPKSTKWTAQRELMVSDGRTCVEGRKSQERGVRRYLKGSDKTYAASCYSSLKM